MNKENKLSFWIQTKILSLFSEGEEIKSNLLFGKGDGEGRTVQTGKFAAFTTLIWSPLPKEPLQDEGWCLCWALTEVCRTPALRGRVPAGSQPAACPLLGGKATFSEGTALGHLALYATRMQGPNLLRRHTPEMLTQWTSAEAGAQPPHNVRAGVGLQPRHSTNMWDRCICRIFKISCNVQLDLTYYQLKHNHTISWSGQ